MLRVGMTNPPYMLEHLEEIAQVLLHPRVYSFLHIPVQSGSNWVLDAMKREYTVEQFDHIVEYLYARVPGMTLATDIICGFPGETEAHFEETMALINKYEFGIMNYTQFYARPGTPAAKMKKVDTRVARARTKAITQVFDKWEPYTGLVGQTVRVWITEEIARDKKHMIGHTKCYVQVLLPLDTSLFGSSCNAEITAAGRFHVMGHVVSQSEHSRAPELRTKSTDAGSFVSGGEDDYASAAPAEELWGLGQVCQCVPGSSCECQGTTAGENQLELEQVSRHRREWSLWSVSLLVMCVALWAAFSARVYAIVSNS
eukprot:TRINITY_DN43808_c0_g1_i1.p1 TRINITY_DN43808_c0_g1~~TRINITY_DN43808_c0_g1_i1.p1  ORF type:complete len:314 (-),score=61.88 TRINITY_DN43808_c0_g1_i1:291-1232(-)